MAMTHVDGPGWVDQRTSPIMGLFPIAVEQYLNSAVAVHAPGVTTVTTTARYFALHGLVAHEATRRDLDDTAARDLLRRSEVVYALACMAHRDSSEHVGEWPAPHGEDKLRSALESGAVDLTVAAGHGTGRYSNSSWGFLGAYRGSEMTLGILSTDSFRTGEAFDVAPVSSALRAVVDLASKATAVSLADVAGLTDVCLCQARFSADGEWLARLFAGRPHDLGTVAGVLGQTQQMIAAAIQTTPVENLEDLARFVMYDPQMLTHGHAGTGDVWRRWRGLRTRAESVHAWRLLWAHMCDALTATGAMTPALLAERLADEMPTGSLRAYVDDLPAVTDAGGQPLPAERDASVSGRADVDRWVAMLLLGGQRHHALNTGRDTPERRGFEGPAGHPLGVEELSPHWVAAATRSWADRSVQDLAVHLAQVMVNRAHRVTMAKSRFRRSDQRFIMPVRVVLDDGLVYRVHGEVARPPSLRWAQLMSMSRQVGLLARDDNGAWTRGPRGALLD
ncbi:hypothetical protein [Cellulomonas dongxiuzhuiae]|uniref:hypothetical protein n=1 Tax=Cellulomonas dongxiuzhuiae TaxID=2819979 RepID=UPI001AAF9DE9|nr:hypothetical protein [Cellulomonas dongxiuzhuiae]MBO3089495.1 hypothetical protein [Cellulomonas dongxiuzhuiae]